MSAYVSDWSQEVYPDYRRYAVPGAEISLRRDYLNDYLQHALVVSRAGPSTIEPGRTYLAQALSPLAGAAWQYDSGYGWTNVPYDQMQAFVSGQVYALRSASVAAGAAQDHWGFAWQPKNASGLSAGDFASQTGAILDRLGAAIRDSGDSDVTRPGKRRLRAARPEPVLRRRSPGRIVRGAVEGVSRLVAACPHVLTPPQTLTAGTPSTPMSLSLVTSAGAPQIATTPVVVTLTSSSAQGGFSLGSTGPWAPTFTAAIPAGGNASPPFFYRDTLAGRSEVRATAASATTATQLQTVVAGPPAKPADRPRRGDASTRVGRRASRSPQLDAFGNPTAVRAATGRSSRRALGTVSPRSGGKTLFTRWNARRARSVARRRSARSPRMRGCGSTRARSGSRRSGIRRGRRCAGHRERRRDGRCARAWSPDVDRRTPQRPGGAGAEKRTDDTGRATYLVPRSSGCYSTTVTGVTAPGYRWSGKTPANRFCG